MDVVIINLTSPVGFSAAALEQLRGTRGVYKVLNAAPSEDGLYRDIWLHVSKEFNEIAAEFAHRSA